MRISCILLVFILLYSCKKEVSEGVEINLTQKTTDIYYSDFVDSVSFLTLYTNDSCIVSQVRQMYIDSAYIILSDRSGNGVCVFLDNKLICNIAHYGRGPQEFIRIASFCVDKLNKHICIYDDESRKLLKYTYHGRFVGEYPFKDLMRSFTNVKGRFLCLQPSYLHRMRSGVWIADSVGKFVKKLFAGSSDNVYEALYPQYFNYYCDEGISYYDRYDNRLFFITPDSACLKYQFNLKPALPIELKRSEDKGLQDYFMLATCYDLEKYLLLFYGSTQKFYQVLYDKKDNTYRITENIVNDLLPVHATEVSTHYINKNVLAVELGAEENDYNLRFQILHVFPN